jgi:hypothetical protein
VDTYDRHGRISGTLTDRAIADVADAWRADMLAGHHTIVVTDTVQAASEMSAACQQRLIDAGRLADDPIASAADSNQIYVGDLIQTRRNTRQLSTSDGHRVLNRDVWRATGSDRHGNLTATHTSTATTVTITPDYLATDVVLAYATTIAGAQGRTADRSHILVTPTTSAESLYVGMTRGRHRNTAHVICDRHDHDELELGDRTPTQAFTAAMRRDSDGSLSARTIAQRWHDDQPARGAAREADRRLRSAQEWWTNRSRHLPLRLQRALAVRHDDIVRILSRRSNDTERAAAIASALKSAPAHRTDFASRFIDSLNTNGARPTPPGDAHRVGATRGVGRER